jgi:hypothetical protein
MSTSRWILSVGPLGLVACTTNIPTDTAGDPGSREIPPSGVIRGAILYNGPHPCSQNGHIVGSAVVLVFDRRNPPPPNGLATTAVNFVAVTGDLLFPNEPRWPGSNRYCPLDHGITDDVTVTAPFAISPLVAGSYVLEAFFDYTGNFLPTFKFRNLPEQGDVGGGVIDTAAALQPVNQNPNYLPDFLPVDVGTPQPLPAGSPPGLVPLYSMPSSGYVADNVNVTIGKVFTNTRPYFYAQGLNVALSGSAVTLTQGQSSDTPLCDPSKLPVNGKCPSSTNTTGITGSLDMLDPNYAPILTIPQDIQVLAAPSSTFDLKGAALFESKFPHLRLMWGVGGPPKDLANAKASPFNMQIAPFTNSSDPAGGGISVWVNQYFDPSSQSWQNQTVPENTVLPDLWPLVVLSKLVDDPDPNHTNDPARLQAQGDATHPVVIMQGITLLGGSMTMPSGTTDNDTLVNTASALTFLQLTEKGTTNPIIFKQDHVTVMMRPNVICFDKLFDPNYSDKRGVIVAPYLTAMTADTLTPPKMADIVPSDLLTAPEPRASVANLVKPPPGYTGGPPGIAGCLPLGRYSINVVYPTGQAWTVPNEAGACTGDATGEGTTTWQQSTLTCTVQDRNVIRSQGPRAVVEVVKGTTGYCSSHPVPQQCLVVQ